ncbi:MAG TPA: PKD domain-containing protein [Chitinophagaceae bacterium]|nr:PKD domain-containing protein [Chitinophagaceae bacterium]
MKKNSILFIFAILLSSLCGKAQIISTESFDATTFAPAGWSIKVDLSPATNVWVRQTNGTNPNVLPHSGAGLARFRSRSVAAGTKQILISRTIDYTTRGTSAANLNFWMYRDSLLPANMDSLSVWVNSTDTIDATAIKLGTIVRNRSIAMPDTQASNGWYYYSYAIPASFTGTNTRFIFEGTGESAVINQGANIFIDDISFDEFPAVCAGMPNVGSIINPTPLICGGGGSSSLSLSAPITGVLGITYTWQSSASGGGPWTTIGTNSPTLSIPSITSTTFYQCLVNCSFSGFTYASAVDSIVISSNVPPTITVTPSSTVFCAGSNGAQLIASGANSYSWSPASSLNVSSGDTVLASPTTNTTYTITGIDSIGCSNTETVNVSFNPGPAVNITANPNDTVCAGTQVVLTSVASGAAGNIYLWSDGITTRRDTIIVVADITLSVIVTNSAGCSRSDTITVVATPPSIANFGWTNLSGNTFNFIDSSSTAGSWTWTFGDGNGSTNQSPTYTYSAPGTYTVTLIISGTSCNDDTISKVIVVGPQGVSNIENNAQIISYPNPVQQELNIESKNEIIDFITIRNSLGERIISFSNTNQSNKIKVSTNRLASGIYFADIFVNGQNHPIKFIKE